MKNFCVSVPICGIAVVIVEAENEDDAKRKAMSGQRIQLENIEEWEALEHVTEGNCFNGPLNDIEVEEQ
jgi:hypothetical protein